MRVSCDSPSLILIYAHWANRDLIIGAKTENNTECYLRLFSQMLFFFSSGGQSPSMRDASYSKFAI